MKAGVAGQDILDLAKAGFLAIGYGTNLLRDNYQFADIFAPNHPVRNIELAIFAQDPPSYRSACFGFTRIDGDLHSAEQLENYRALGAPQFFIIQPTKRLVNRWKMTAAGKPQFVEQIDTDRLPNAIMEHKVEWNPDTMLRARSISSKGTPVQLDMFDLGLLPLIEGEIQRKLDDLLRRVISSSFRLYSEIYHHEPDYRALFHLIFRLIAAKQLADRRHPGAEWNSRDAQTVIRAIEQYYFQNSRGEPLLEDKEIQNLAWEQIREAFHFGNVSVETLAYVYENTLVSSETRRRYDVHATPPSIAEYIVRSLPIEELPFDERSVFEPFSGHAPFLTASLSLLRMLLPSNFPSSQRHEYFIRMLKGMEIDTFAREVARNSLILADYPNPDGWQIINDDVFTSPHLGRYLSESSIVLCNPPFGNFDQGVRMKYPNLSANKAVEALRRVLQYSPRMLGFVLPRVFVDGPKFRSEREKMAKLYGVIDIVSLPRTAFQHSDVETVLVLAHGTHRIHTTFRVGAVRSGDYDKFLHMGHTSWRVDAPLGYIESKSPPRLWYEPIQYVLDELAHLPRLESVAETHRGIEFNKPLKARTDDLISDQKKDGFMLGLVNTLRGFEPYFIRPYEYLNVSPEVMRGNAYLMPWHKPKVIASASRMLSDGWVIAAGIDYSGIVCYQAFHGIWPKGDLPLEILAAILNGPIANAHLSTFRTSRGNQVRNVRSIPIPYFNPVQRDRVIMLVREYQKLRSEWTEAMSDVENLSRTCLELISQIDGEVLAAYDLPPRMERKLLDYFAGLRRPGPIGFERYYPSDFRPAIPWREYISTEFLSSSARETIKRLPVLHDRAITEMLRDLDV